MRAHALNVAGVACARALSGARMGSGNLAPGRSAAKPWVGVGTRHQSPQGARSTTGGAATTAIEPLGMALIHCECTAPQDRCRPYRALSRLAPCHLGLRPRLSYPSPSGSRGSSAWAPARPPHMSIARDGRALAILTARGGGLTASHRHSLLEHLPPGGHSPPAAVRVPSGPPRLSSAPGGSSSDGSSDRARRNSRAAVSVIPWRRWRSAEIAYAIAWTRWSRA